MSPILIFGGLLAAAYYYQKQKMKGSPAAQAAPAADGSLPGASNVATNPMPGQQSAPQYGGISTSGLPVLIYGATAKPPGFRAAPLSVAPSPKTFALFAQ